jgi:hypothetical protein
VAAGPFCWNAECRKCEIECSMGADGLVFRALACQVKGAPGLHVRRLSPELRYALATCGALAATGPEGASD